MNRKMLVLVGLFFIIPMCFFAQQARVPELKIDEWVEFKDDWFTVNVQLYSTVGSKVAFDQIRVTITNADLSVAIKGVIVMFRSDSLRPNEEYIILSGSINNMDTFFRLTKNRVALSSAITEIIKSIHSDKNESNIRRVMEVM